MKPQLDQVLEFHNSFRLPYKTQPALAPDEFHLRYELMKEENQEYLEACQKGDLVEIADALGDQLYVLCGTIISHGMQDKIAEVFTEIHRSNMSKLDEKGQPIYREDGKILKSEGFFRPNLAPIIEKP